MSQEPIQVLELHINESIPLLPRNWFGAKYLSRCWSWTYPDKDLKLFLPLELIRIWGNLNTNVPKHCFKGNSISLYAPTDRYVFYSIS